MQTGKYSRWSIAVSAVVGIALIIAGLVLLQRDAARRAEPSEPHQHEARP